LHKEAVFSYYQNMAIESNAEKLKRSPYITKSLWSQCKGLATMKGKTIGEWVAEAMVEKYRREYKDIKPEVQNERQSS